MNRQKNRIILLGASNLTLSLRLVIDLMQQRIGRASEVFAATGHGRAYGCFSEMLLRGLPGIADCGLWRQLDTSDTQPVYALLTDIGNDIMYELPPAKVLLAVEWCIKQLQRHSAQIVVTGLPMASVERLTESRYTFFRNLFYPCCRLSRVEAIDRVQAIHAGLVEMAALYRFTLIEQQPCWFGVDGIHVRFERRADYYRNVLNGFTGAGYEPESGYERVPLLFWKRRATFAYKTILGWEFICSQPSGLLLNGSKVFKY
ncbi:MAG: hypothetical protein A4S08_00740 [Proteobacteria bacterium SG_bin4]|nr:MAG: hypothetical protein A4S08_00740 [Proteobacteria bacterium SG_bin4]